ncbi:MAG: NlpC/P60 family protein, partial [Thermomicrobia bacterium]|nr:NlpC/P60 family protein [Thermomicrobia bacterium]
STPYTTIRTEPSASGSSAPSGSNAIVRVAQRYLGAYRQPSGLPWAFWCEKFVGDVADNAGVGHYRFATAIADAYSGPLNRGMAPAGTLVFFDQSWNYAGHVGIAMGDGTMISALSNGVVRTAYAGSSGYLGWRPFP